MQRIYAVNCAHEYMNMLPPPSLSSLLRHWLKQCFKYNTQYSEWAVRPLSSVFMFMNFTAYHPTFQRFYWLENAMDWLRNANNTRNATCADTQTSNKRSYC